MNPLYGAVVCLADRGAVEDFSLRRVMLAVAALPRCAHVAVAVVWGVVCLWW